MAMEDKSQRINFTQKYLVRQSKQFSEFIFIVFLIILRYILDAWSKCKGITQF